MLIVRVPFPNKSAAEIAYRTLTVDDEPQRASTSVQLFVENTILGAKFMAGIENGSKMDPISQLKKLRVTINHWLESLSLICETLSEFGDPSADMPNPTCAITGDVHG